CRSPSPTYPIPSRCCGWSAGLASPTPLARCSPPAQPSYWSAPAMAEPDRHTPLVAVTRRLDDEVDLIEFAGADGVVFERDGIGLAGVGTALTIETEGDPATAAESVDAALSPIDVDDEVGQPGCGPVAFGALPFVPG